MNPLNHRDLLVGALAGGTAMPGAGSTRAAGARFFFSLGEKPAGLSCDCVV